MKNNDPIVTFIYPTIREDRYSRLSFDSLRKQTIANNIEILSFESRDITPGQAINAGLSMAKGELICWAYDDDVNYLEKAEIFKMYADKYKEHDVFYASSIVIDSKNCVKGIYEPPIFNYDIFKKEGNFISTMAACVRRESVGELRFREDYPLTDEYVFFLNCYQKGLKFKRIGVPIAFIRHWSDQRTFKYHEDKKAEHVRIREEYGEDFYINRKYNDKYFEKVTA